MLDPAFLRKLREAAQRLFSGHRILAAYAYGSRVSGRPSVRSDLDIGYYPTGYRKGELLPIHEEMILQADLSAALGVQVDLRNLAGAPLELRGRVLEEGVRVYSGDDAQRVDLECAVLARYHDYKDIFREMHEIRLRQSAERGL